MRTPPLILAWLLSIWLLAACASGSVASATRSPIATPTTHPIFSGAAAETPMIDASPAPGTTPQSNLEAGAQDTGLEIKDAHVQPGEDNAIISWATSRPAVSRLAYGRTELYEIDNLGDELLLTQHAVILINLEPETTYHYRITTFGSENGVADAIVGSFDTINRDPIIDVWYGRNQSFGQVGTPQRWINILGNVSDVDGIESLVYSLNKGPEIRVAIGPDLRRLGETGDFNLDIDRTLLKLQENEVVIKATDTLNNQRVVTMTVNYSDKHVWPGTYNIDWQTVTNIQEVAQPVDGLWIIDKNEVRIALPDYDRLLAIGDIAWTDYEVTVPITLHDIDTEKGFNHTSSGPGLGLLMRWTGHTDFPIPDWQPKVGWKPFGVIAWYRWETPDSVFLRIEGTSGDLEELPSSIPELNVRYMYKLRVETMPSGGGLYQFKVWQADKQEPEAWDLSSEFGGPPNGSLLLLAHQVDASFGNVTITQLAPPTTTPFLPDVLETPDITNTLPVTSTLPITTTLPITGTETISDTTSLPDG